MTVLDILIIAAVAIWLGAVLFFAWRNRRRAGSCSGCCATCRQCRKR